MTTLRALEPNDIDLLFDVENDAAMWDVGNTNMPYSRKFLSDYILNTTGDIYTDKQLRLVIECDGSPAGLVDLTDFDPKNMRAEVGITVTKAFRNRGIAFEAMQLIVNYAAKTLHLHQLYAIIPETNEPSLKLFAKCAFDKKVLLTDWVADGKKHKNALLVQKIL